MVSVSQQIEDAIQVVSCQRAVFTVRDVAAYSNLEGAEKFIRAVLQQYCGKEELLNLDSPHTKTTSDYRYIKKLEVERWWVRQTIRWAESGLNYLTAGQLAGAMSLAFDDCRWATPPLALLEAAHRWAMVDSGSVPGTYVFPWASVLRANPQFIGLFRSIFDSQSDTFHLKNQLDETYTQYQWKHTWDHEIPSSLYRSAIIAATDAAVSTLRHREAEVIRGRYGLDTGHVLTLEELGFKFGVTRERIRQIESKALKKLKGLPAWHYGFAVNFIHSGGSLLISESDIAPIAPQWELLSGSIGLNAVSIPELGLCVIGGADGVSRYRSHLNSVAGCSEFTDAELDKPVLEELQFLPRQDEMRLQIAEREYWDIQEKYHAEESARTRPRMAFQALRSIGRAAHYGEIAEECNRLFPERPNTTHNWHAALLLPESQDLGIVWIGRKGVYGLVEQGYSRPTRDLFDAVASIVEARFVHTGQPVPFDFVMRELGNERQNPDPNSVNIALSINDRLASKGSGRYVPIAQAPSKSSASASTHYDLDAGFDAFVSGN